MQRALRRYRGSMSFVAPTSLGGKRSEGLNRFQYGKSILPAFLIPVHESVVSVVASDKLCKIAIFGYQRLCTAHRCGRLNVVGLRSGRSRALLGVVTSHLRAP